MGEPVSVADQLRRAIASLEADAKRKDLQPTFRKQAKEIATKMKATLFFMENPDFQSRGKRKGSAR